MPYDESRPFSQNFEIYVLVYSTEPIVEIPFNVINMQRDLTPDEIMNDIISNTKGLTVERPNLPYFIDEKTNTYHYFYLINKYHYDMDKKLFILKEINIPISDEQPFYSYNFNKLKGDVNQYIKDVVLPKVGGKRMKKRKSIKRKSIKRKTIKRKTIKRKTTKRRYTK